MAYCTCPNYQKAREEAMDDMEELAMGLYATAIKPKMPSASEEDGRDIIGAITEALGAVAGVLPEPLLDLPSPSNMVH